MTALHEVVDLDEFARALDAGHLRVQQHPSEPLSIANYSEKCVIERAWNRTTLACRGLIWNRDTGQVVARPFPKFFNHSEVNAPVIALDAQVTVTDKQDGSLGIIYRLPSGPLAVATRGSFTSEQAVHATALLRQRYGSWDPGPRFTYLVEIIYPQNRIVVDYQGLDDLVLLGAVSIPTGQTYGPDTLMGLRDLWPGPVTEVFSYHTFAEALAAEPRPGMEGLVVHDLATDARVKLKQSDYIDLHRIVTGLNARKVHEWMVAKLPLDDLLVTLPDEFHDWVRAVAADIADTVRTRTGEIEAQWRKVVAMCEAASSYNDGWPIAVSMGLDSGESLSREERALFAGIAQKFPDAWALFSKLDGKDYASRLLVDARPEPYLTPNGRSFTEATS